jgi:hypothetical protein
MPFATPVGRGKERRKRIVMFVTSGRWVGFVLHEKLLLDKSTCGFWALWSSFWLLGAKATAKSPTKHGLSLGSFPFI